VAGAASLLLAAPALADAPVIGYGLKGQLGDNGWFVSPVTITWSVSNATSSSGCNVQTISTDTPGTTITCSALNNGVEAAISVPVKVDQTPPTDVTAAPSRGPDSRSYFTAPVGIAWSGKDATSGVASCTALDYAGPDGTNAPAGTCRDRAGNVSSAVPFSLDYDATPPGLTGVSATASPGRAEIRWAASPDTVRVTVVRDGSPPMTVMDGPPVNGVADTNLAPGTAYRWTVTAFDEAGNAATQAVMATTPAKPKAVRLRWRRVPGATYYNVQLFRAAHKVLSAWPSQPRFRVATAWRFRGTRQHLLAGRTYRWYAWAGFGPRSARRYGRLLALGSFKVPG
jgi:hypothetical protein